MSKGVDMDVLVMDVEGTDGRERGEDQVRLYCRKYIRRLILLSRILSANPLSFRWPPPKSFSSIYGSTRSVFTKAPIWAC